MKYKIAQFEILLNDQKILGTIVCIEYNNKESIQIKISNNQENIILSWIPPVKFTTPKFMQHLAVCDYTKRTVENWEDLKYKECPIDIEKNTGIIFENNNYLCTKGNNEFSVQDGKTIVTLYRSVGVLGKANLKIRPGVASGLENHTILTPRGQLKKDLYFDFEIGITDDINNTLSSFYKKIISYHPNSSNVIYSHMERFITIRKDFEIIKFQKPLPNVFLSCLRTFDNKILCRYLNIDENNNEYNFNEIREEVFNYE